MSGVGGFHSSHHRFLSNNSHITFIKGDTKMTEITKIDPRAKVVILDTHKKITLWCIINGYYYEQNLQIYEISLNFINATNVATTL